MTVLGGGTDVFDLRNTGAVPAAPASQDGLVDPYRDMLLSGMELGRFGDIVIEAPAAKALVEVLRRRGWPIDLRKFSNAIPHMPDRFELLELRLVLSRLGFETRMIEQDGRNLGGLPNGSMVLDSQERILFCSVDEKGRDVLVDPDTGQKISIGRRRRYNCLLVDGAEADTARKKQPVAPVLSRIESRFRPELQLLIFLTILSGLLVVVASKSVAFVFQMVLPAKALDTLLGLMIGLGGLFAFDLAIRQVRARIVARISARIEYILSGEIYDKLMSLPLNMMQASSVSDQINRMKHFETVRDFFVGPVATVLFEIPFIVVLVGVIFFTCSHVGLFIVLSVIGFAIAAILAVPRLRSAGTKMNLVRSDYLRRMGEALDRSPEIMQRGLGPAFAGRIQPIYERYAAAQFELDRASQRLANVSVLLAPVTMSGVILIGAREVMKGDMSAGMFIVTILLTTRLLAPVQQAMTTAVRMPEVLKVFGQIDNLMRIDPGRSGASVMTPDRKNVRQLSPPLRIEEVVMRYPLTNAPALHAVSARVPYGKLTCLCGPTGAGKTTLLRSVAGLCSLQAGAIFLGEVNMQQLGPMQRTDLVGYMGHKPLLVHGTVAQNLRLTAPGLPTREMERVCDELGILPQIEGLPDGFHTRLTREVQISLSPVFRTKLAIAQLLLRDPVILLLDSPDSGLSHADELRLFTAIARRRERMTTIFVTHKQKVLKRADHVLALKAGKLVFSGHPDKLNLEKLQ
ncbi:putative ABC transporter ATP-binding protein [Rhodovulum sp. P5]|uniref:ATP-binding cassette domain-containing protein n=1 Tax=Rhodovulum sp. P5 TaxID=1564506 RepID=UPI0009C3C32B|nr:ATP-binding cassette domain-containing protein [Rhodovulum sp. P5]ARE40533.1 putative ABC transporter ATP-binding protein [Rhodovulum sp. P5]